MKRADRRASVWPPVVTSALALTALNLVIASWIARLVSPSVAVLPPLGLAALLVLALLLAAAALRLWRRYLR
jgi:hypothetical protein